LRREFSFEIGASLICKARQAVVTSPVQLCDTYPSGKWRRSGHINRRANSEWRVGKEIRRSSIRHFLFAIRALRAFAPYAATARGCREITSVNSEAMIHSAPAAKNAGR